LKIPLGNRNKSLMLTIVRLEQDDDIMSAGEAREWIRLFKRFSQYLYRETAFAFSIWRAQPLIAAPTPDPGHLMDYRQVLCRDGRTTY